MQKWLRHSLAPAAGCLALVAAQALLPPAGAAQEGTKRALIIAIGEYGVAPNNPVTGRPLLSYRDLSSANDVVLVRGALEHQGFLARDIRVLSDSLATVAGIRAALARLERETGRGDVVVIHYSGHGHRITNDNPLDDNELDGLDEVLVPFGAPAEFYEGYDGSLHFRDDEFGEHIARIRARAGATGNVTVFLDACYSGTGTRGGDQDELPARGEERPLGAPAFAAGGGTRGSGEDEDRGTGIEVGRAPGTRGGDAGLATFAVFSAASPRQMAKETFDADGRTKVGSLSYAVSRALTSAGPGTTNRDLFAMITRSLLGRVTNQTPQLEGDADRELFSNRLTRQLPYVVVDSAWATGLSLAGGTLIGLNPGTELEVHPLGTSSPDQGRALATIRVREATPLSAVAELVTGAPTDATGAWAFVTRRTFGELTLRVRLDASLPQNDVTGLTRRFESSGMVQIVEAGGDVVVVGTGGQPEARVVADGRSLARGAQGVGAAVEDYARNRYLRGLQLASEELDLVLEIAPGVDYLRAQDRCTLPDWASTEGRPDNLGGGQWRLAPGAFYVARARNVGERPAFVYLVELSPDGGIELGYPLENEPGEEVMPGATADLGCYVVPEGTEGNLILKLFATETRQDQLRSWFQSARTRAAAPELALSREIIINVQPN